MEPGIVGDGEGKVLFPDPDSIRRNRLLTLTTSLFTRFLDREVLQLRLEVVLGSLTDHSQLRPVGVESSSKKKGGPHEPARLPSAPHHILASSGVETLPWCLTACAGTRLPEFNRLARVLSAPVFPSNKRYQNYII